MLRKGFGLIFGDVYYVTVASGSPYQGTYYASLGTVGSIGDLYQNITRNPGDTFQLTYYLASDGDTPNEFQTIVGGTTRENIYACIQFAAKLMANHYEIRKVA